MSVMRDLPIYLENEIYLKTRAQNHRLLQEHVLETP